jgi:hypothetical protein
MASPAGAIIVVRPTEGESGPVTAAEPATRTHEGAGVATNGHQDDASATTRSSAAGAAPGRIAAWASRHRTALFVVYLVAVAGSVVAWGVPTRRDRMFFTIGVGLLLTTVGQARAWRRVIRDWLPLFLLLTFYDFLRSHAKDWGTVHVLPQLHADEWLFGGTAPTVSLQHAMFTPGQARWWDYATFVVYLSHFVVPILVAALLWKLAYPRFGRYATLFVTLTFLGFATYALYPASPPWLASQSGALAPTAKIVDEMWLHIGLARGAHVLSSTSHLANPVAAVPSLHAAYPFLLMLFFWRSAGRYRFLLPLYPLAMGFTLVYTAEHYVVDILLGWIYATVVFVVGSWALDRWNGRAHAHAVERVPSGCVAPH